MALATRPIYRLLPGRSIGQAVAHDHRGGVIRWLCFVIARLVARWCRDTNRCRTWSLLALGGSARLGRYDGVRGVHQGTIRRFVLADLPVDVLLGDGEDLYGWRRQVRHPCADPDCHDVPDEHRYPGCHYTHWPSAGVDSHLGCQYPIGLPHHRRRAGLVVDQQFRSG